MRVSTKGESEEEQDQDDERGGHGPGRGRPIAWTREALAAGHALDAAGVAGFVGDRESPALTELAVAAPDHVGRDPRGPAGALEVP